MLKFRKPFLEIESANIKNPAYILSIEKPCITVNDFTEKDTLKLTNLYFIYQGLDKDDNDYNDISLLKRY